MKINFQIVTPERVVYENEIDQVTLPTRAGEITVLPNHTPLVSLLAPGEMHLKKDGVDYSFAVSSGFIEVRPKSRVVILADTAERAEEIDLARAEAARKRTEKILAEKGKLDDVQFARLQAILDREAARIKVKSKYRGRH